MNAAPAFALLVAIVAVPTAPKTASAADLSVAVAANFTDAAKEIAAAYEAETGTHVRLSFGSTGTLYSQISQGAPFEVFLAADQERPRKALEEELAVAGSDFTYAVGRLVLWSAEAETVAGEETLRTGGFSKLAVADPTAAPYGAAAIEVIERLGLTETLRSKLVQGSSIAQTFQFVQTGNAELGFVALSQVPADGGSRWEVPQSLYTPIRQDAVLLKTGAADPAARAFCDFLRSPQATAIIARYGYGLPGGS
ncbi:molybdate ABC transporter substrate-binding protein [Mangrovibrevibacter kandeliae]|uniref:molybdate ABC transporter substrate-binding protein n=1 Tax=Mangrovibrevibacter kandeliae TaxID=2968473 RepID=UPI0021199D90|nr:molybdate ABC transporter substrate-binding protein [Aurantimonas sp. CSK15Z-1]MCQ8782484.1 molybdate ABC transporter substrate-binding protein [Aurantimonas sp. CSK15Z-1]